MAEWYDNYPDAEQAAWAMADDLQDAATIVRNDHDGSFEIHTPEEAARFIEDPDYTIVHQVDYMDHEAAE